VPTAGSAPALGHDLDQGPGAALLGGRRPLHHPAHHHDPAAVGQRLRGMLGLAAPYHHGKNDASWSRRPGTATRNMAQAMLASVCRNSGLSVRLPAMVVVVSGMGVPSLGA
jgi:hypothetical protein